MSQGSPAMCTGITARVRRVRARSRCSAVMLQVDGIDVGEHGPRAEVGHDLRRRGERIGRDDDVVAGLHAADAEREVERGRARGEREHRRRRRGARRGHARAAASWRRSSPSRSAACRRPRRSPPPRSRGGGTEATRRGRPRLSGAVAPSRTAIPVSPPGTLEIRACRPMPARRPPQHACAVAEVHARDGERARAAPRASRLAPPVRPRARAPRRTRPSARSASRAAGGASARQVSRRTLSTNALGTACRGREERGMLQERPAAAPARSSSTGARGRGATRAGGSAAPGRRQR